MGNIGSSELLIILVLALLLLGPKRLPEVGEALGRTLRRFREASRELRSEIDVKHEIDPGGELRRGLDLTRDTQPRQPSTQPEAQAQAPVAPPVQSQTEAQPRTPVPPPSSEV